MKIIPRLIPRIALAIILNVTLVVGSLNARTIVMLATAFEICLTFVIKFDNNAVIS